MFNLFKRGFSLIRINRISSATKNKKLKLGFLGLSLKYFVAIPSLMTHASLFQKIISIHVIKFCPNSNFFKTEIKNLWSNESKVFFKSIFTKKPSICWILVISLI